jgi:heme exporter protein C
MAWVSFVAFVSAGVWSLLYLAGKRTAARDRAAAAAVELGLVFGVLATVTGAIWAKVMWGAWWNWDPRQTSIVIALLFYAAYLALRGAVADSQTRARLAAAYALLGLAVAPFLFFVLPRLGFTLHPEPVINSTGKIAMESRMVQVLVMSLLGFTALFFWLHSLACRAAERLESALLHGENR